MLNPLQRFPAVDTQRRAPSPTMAQRDQRRDQPRRRQGHAELTADEYYLLILNIDMGGQFFFRENMDDAGSSHPVTGDIDMHKRTT